MNTISETQRIQTCNVQSCFLSLTHLSPPPLASGFFIHCYRPPVQPPSPPQVALHSHHNDNHHHQLPSLNQAGTVQGSATGSTNTTLGAGAASGSSTGNVGTSASIANHMQINSVQTTTTSIDGSIKSNADGTTTFGSNNNNGPNPIGMNVPSDCSSKLDGQGPSSGDGTSNANNSAPKPLKKRWLENCEFKGMFCLPLFLAVLLSLLEALIVYVNLINC